MSLGFVLRLVALACFIAAALGGPGRLVAAGLALWLASEMF